MASERPGSSDCLADQASTFSRISDESRTAVTESWPVAGRPLCFRTTCFLELIEQSVDETLTYYAFPDIHWQKIRTNNPLERIMKRNTCRWSFPRWPVVP